ncbi:serine/threonine-protein kinase pim-2-like [Astyanax mexicanus]|uniref:non-specific serine/threonine protein kinase n=1 Tax=Astyanax mexicanus TaxID=7994 RepID=A0A8T2ME96_ASTMX|nr:serine/threonine-protein kinase pim-2-like [Astyanax mexicanus]
MIQVHTRGVLHRDLKPENLLVQTGAEGPLLRLMDFGCGCLIGEDSYTEFDGTTQYIPPEFFTQGSYQAEPTTVWQIGVILYNMLCGKCPFTDSKQIIGKTLYTPPRLSFQCKKLLRRLLSKCPQRRPSLRHLLQNPWLSLPDNTHTHRHIH